MILGTAYALYLLKQTGIIRSQPISFMEEDMNDDKVKGNWKEMKGKVQQKWGKLTDDDVDKIDGRREELVGKLQQQYGKSREEAEREVDDYFK